MDHGAERAVDSTQEASTSGTQDGEQKEKIQRQKKKCPFPSCNANVFNLPRHMIQVHNWGKNDALAVINSFNLRTARKGSQNSKLKPKVCPVDGCISVVKRLHNHLKDFHGMKKETNAYKKCLRKAIPHEVIDISSESTCESSSDGEEQRQFMKEMRKSEKSLKRKRTKQPRKEKHESIFKQVYSSDDEDSGDDSRCLGYPAIFKRSPSSVGESFDKLPSVNELQRDRVPELPVSELQEPQVGELPDIAEPGGGNSDTDGMSNKGDTSDKWSSEEQETIDQSSDDGDYIEESECEVEEDQLLLNGLPDEKVVLEEFEKWLQTADGGRKDEANATRCSRQVQLVMLYINPEKPVLKDIMDKKSLRDKWLNKIEKERRPGTVKSYLGALRQFYSFLQCESPQNVETSPKALSGLIAQMTQWSKSFHKLIKSRFWEKRLDDLEKLRTPEQIREFASSDLARAAVNTLGEYQAKPDGTMPSQAEYTSVRDYLLTSICINNASRSGALANMKMAEFRKAQKLDDSFVVKVTKHKTYETHGPANVVLTPTLHNWMNIFIRKFRNPVADSQHGDAEPVFLSWGNRAMDSSQVGSQMNSCWGKVFGKEVSTGGATAFRKAAVSAVHQNDKGRRQELAGLMVHHVETANKYYLLEEKAAAAVKTSKYLSNVLHGKAQCTGDIAPSVDDAANIEDANVPSAPHEWSAQTRRKWTPEEGEEVKTLFANEIKEQKISTPTVRAKVEGNSILEQIPVRKVRDKIRTFFGSVEGPQLPDLPEETSRDRLTRAGFKPSSKETPVQAGNECESEYTPSEHPTSMISPSTSVSKNTLQKLFVNDEYDDFVELFKDLIGNKKPITRKEVKERLEGKPSLSNLLKKYSLLQLSDKVRHERKALARSAAQK